MENRKAGLQLETILIDAIMDDNYIFSAPDYQLKTTQLPADDQGRLGSTFKISSAICCTESIPPILMKK